VVAPTCRRGLLPSGCAGTYAPSVIVDNRVGASGRIGIEAVKAADPDGASVVFTPDFPFTVYPHSFRKLAYDPVRDFVPVAIAARSQLALAAGARNAGHDQDAARIPAMGESQPPRGIVCDDLGGRHAALRRRDALARIEHRAHPVHYKGGAPAIQDLVGGQIPVSVNPVGELLPHVRAGKVRVLATTGAKRTRFLPDVPTMAESGYPDVVVEAWLGFLAPAKTPADVVARLAAAVAAAAKADDVVQGLERFGMESVVSMPAEFAATLKADIERWAPIVKASGFTAED
jgi:tripartite-type tricarboxylate transporter receptor subunit TctC